MDFEKLTLKSQEAVATAQELARRLGNPELYPEHLLLALLDQELPQQLVPDPAALRAQAEATLRAKPRIEGAQQQPHVSSAFSRPVVPTLMRTTGAPRRAAARILRLSASACSLRLASSALARLPSIT